MEKKKNWSKKRKSNRKMYGYKIKWYKKKAPC